jgi:hypothetical protein
MIHHIPHGYNMFMTRAYDFCWRAEGLGRLRLFQIQSRLISST